MGEINITTTTNYANVSIIENDVVVYVRTDNMLAEVQPIILQNINESVLCNITVDTSNVSYQVTSELINIKLSDVIVASFFEGSPSVYVFDVPSDTWTINHNLNRKVMPQIYTMGGLEMEGNILHLNNNTLQIIFTVPMSGYVILV